jgi:hypothetical protein
MKVQKTISLSIEQAEWLDNQRNFNFSKFVRLQLDELMKYEGKRHPEEIPENFMEKEDDENE